MVDSGERKKRMRATAVEFRLRVAIMAAIVVLGFWAPWVQYRGIGSRTTLEMEMALTLSRTGLLGFAAAIHVVILVATLIALKGAVLRVWGTAYLGGGTVGHGEMQAGRVLAEGPFQLVRNPLYWGSWCMFLAMSFLMPASGALVAMVLLSVFLFRLVLGEEAFLTSQQGEEYREYQRTVPRLFPHWKSIPLAFARNGSARPQWIRAMAFEINPIGVFLIMAGLSWSYDNWLMVRAIVVCLGISIVVHAAWPGARN
jgi:protein-S-isoprenylcysteine O-methyltransferase Ste14